MLKKYSSILLSLVLALSIFASPILAADQRIQYTEEMVGASHPTKSDTLNRLALVEHNTDGTHKQQALNPVGAIMAWPTDTAPTGWLELNGASLSRTTYAALFAVIGTTYGYADASHFYLPDMRGKFIRGWAHGQTTDPDKAARTDRGDGTTGDYVGTKQADAFASHSHTVSSQQFANAAGTYALASGGGFGKNNTDNAGGNETRPVNVNFMWIIKY